jgi:hypothetical protein
MTCGTVLCRLVLWARPSAHDTAHGLFTCAVPPMGHGHFRCVVSAHGTTHMVHRRRGGQKGGRRGTKGEGVADKVSRSSEQGRHAQGE